jgi:hypothetical protein
MSKQETNPLVRTRTLIECDYGQGSHGNCFKWALERVLSKIVTTMVYPRLSFDNVTLKYPDRDWINEPITDGMFKNILDEEVEGIRTRIGLTQFFGDWIALYCGSEGDIKEAYLDVDTNIRVTDQHSFPNNNSMCGMTRPQSFANTPEVLMYNFSRIVNFILKQGINNEKVNIQRLLDMRYPICLGIVDPTIDNITRISSVFRNRPSGVDKKTYANYVEEAFVKFFGVLRNRNAFLDLKTVTLHRKPYLINKGGDLVLVPYIDISVDNVSASKENAQNNYFGDIMEQLNNRLYAEVSVYMPKENSKEYFEGLQTLTENDSLKQTLYKYMTTRRGNIGINKILKTMSKQLPDSPNNFSGHSMALKGIRVDNSTGKKQIYITFINSWDNQTYVEYPVDIFFRVDVHALWVIGSDPGHIRDSDVVDIQKKYMEISVYAPSCIPEYMLKMVASGDTRFYRSDNEGAEVYRVKLANNQDGWGNQESPKRYENDSICMSDTTLVDTPSPNSSPEKNYFDLPNPQKLDLDVVPMKECTQETCSNLPVLETVTGKRERDEGVNKSGVGRLFTKASKQYKPQNHPDNLVVEEFGGGKKNKPKTNKRRAKPRKRVTRKLKNKRATCRVKPCRILKRRTYKKKNTRK